MSYTIKGMNKFIKLSEQIPKEPEAWTCEDVSKWLRLIEMDQYVPNFKEMSIDGWLIFEIEEDDLATDLKISKKLHRKRILKGIKILQEYKIYIRNHLTTKDFENQTLFEQMAVKSKEFQEMVRVEEKVLPSLREQFDDQTRHQDMNSKIQVEKSNNDYI